MDNDDDGGGGVDNPQRRLQTMGRGSDGGGWWRRLSATCGCGGGRLRLGEAGEAALVFVFFVQLASRTLEYEYKVSPETGTFLHFFLLFTCDVV